MIKAYFTREEYKRAWDAYFKANKKRNVSKNTTAAVAGFVSEIVLCRLAGIVWKFAWDAADIILCGLLHQLKSRLESGGGSYAKKTRFTIEHKSDYKDIDGGYIFSKVHLNTDASGWVEYYPNTYNKDWVEKNGISFNGWKMIDESKLETCDDSLMRSLDTLIQETKNAQ